MPDPSDRVWPIGVRCFILGCFYPDASDRCGFCLQSRPLRPLGRSPLADLLATEDAQTKDQRLNRGACRQCGSSICSGIHRRSDAVARSASSQADRSTRVRKRIRRGQDRGHASSRRG